MASLRPAVSATVELPASFAVRNYQDAVESDPAMDTLQPLRVAYELIEERNVFRRRLRQLDEELDVQKKLTQVYGAHLQELIQRVKALGKSKSAELLAGIQPPRWEDTNSVLSDMLRDVGILHSAEFSAALPLVNSYLDRAIQKAKKSAKMYETLEMNASPLIADAWKQVEERLSARIESSDSLISEIRVKAEALNALKSIEAISLEEAVRSSQKLQAVLEDMVLESESWVVCEALHGRIELDGKLKEMIRKRLSLMAQPLTLSIVRDLAGLFTEYEYLRKSATLKPWTDRIHSEGEWWRLVSLCTRLAHASESTLKQISPKATSDLPDLIARLCREVNTDSMGAYAFTTVLLEQLIKVERLKAVNLEVAPRTPEAKSLRKVAKDLCLECLNLACTVATWANQPVQDWLKLRREVESSDSSVTVAATGVMAAVRRLQGCEKVAGGMELEWTLPVLEKCWQAAARSSDQGAEALRREMQRIKDKQEYRIDHRRTFAAVFSSTFPEAPHETHPSPPACDSVLVTQFSHCCSQLPADVSPQTKAWAENCLSRLNSARSAEDKVRIVGSAIAGLAPLLRQGSCQDPSGAHDSGSELAEVVSAAVAFLETAGKPLLISEGKLCLEETSGNRGGRIVRFLRAVFQECKSEGRNQTGDSALAAKLRELYEFSARTAERLADSSRSVENKARTKDSLRLFNAKVVSMNAEELVEALEKVLEIERNQADFLQREEFLTVETVEARPVPKSPTGAQSSVPTCLSKVTEGLQYLIQTVDQLRADFRVRLDEAEHSERIKAIECAEPSDKPLLQEALLHWKLKVIQASVANTHRRLLEKALMSLEQIAELKGKGISQTQIVATVRTVKEDKATLRRPLLRLLEETQDSVNQELPAIAGATFASEEIWTAIQQLVNIYETELQSHNVQLAITQHEEIAITSSDAQTRARAFLRLLGGGMKAISHKMRLIALEGQSAGESALADLEQAIAFLSETEADRYRQVKGGAGSIWKEVENAAAKVKKIASGLFSKAKESNPKLTDIQSQCSGASFDFPSESQSATPLRSRVQATLAPSLSPLDPLITTVLQSLLRLLEHHGATHQIAVGKDKIRTAASVQSKLEFVRDALGSLAQAPTQSFLPLFDGLKKTVAAAASLLPGDSHKIQVANTIATATARVESHRAEAKDCAETLLASLGGVLQALHVKSLQDSEQPGLDPHLRAARKLAATMGTKLSLPSEEQATLGEKADGGAKALLQQSALLSGLQGLHKEFTQSCERLIASLLSHVRALGRVSGSEGHLEQLLASIEKDTAEYGASFTQVFSIDEIIHCLLSDPNTLENPANAV